MTDKTDALVAQMATLLRGLRETVFTARFTDRYGYGAEIDARLNDYEALAAPAEGGQGEVRLWDSQWVNIVNDPEVLNAESQETAVSVAVRMTETTIAKNVADGKLPPVTRKRADSAGGVKSATEVVQALSRRRAEFSERLDTMPDTPQPADGDGAVYQWHEFAGRWEDFTKEQFDEVQSSGEIVLGETIITPAMTRKLYTRPAATAVVPASVLVREINRRLNGDILQTLLDVSNGIDSPATQSTAASAVVRLDSVKKLIEQLAAAPAAPKGGVVDEAMVERAAQAISAAHLSNTGVPFPIEVCRKDARIALTAALATGEQS